MLALFIGPFYFGVRGAGRRGRRRRCSDFRPRNEREAGEARGNEVHFYAVSLMLSTFHQDPTKFSNFKRIDRFAEPNPRKAFHKPSAGDLIKGVHHIFP